MNPDSQVIHLSEMVVQWCTKVTYGI